ncbi:MAG: divergent PAP2 family protein [Spirochaetes bacterium]|nr:MAG: divergent PAP2 family protein [Spirochaetota bacterium]
MLEKPLRGDYNYPMVIASSLIVAASVQIMCQIFKVIFYSVRDKKLTLSYFTTAGGMPSAHSAFVTALSVAVGLKSGFTSDVFAVSTVFSTIVIYDSFRLRGVVEKQSKIINLLITKYHSEERIRAKEMVGHSLSEIAAGILVGSVLSAVMSCFIF